MKHETVQQQIVERVRASQKKKKNNAHMFIQLWGLKERG